MSLQKPAVITDIVGNIELIEDGIQGYVTPAKNSKAMAEAIVKMFDNPDKTKEMGIAAKTRIDGELSSKQTVLKLKQQYQRLLNE